MRNSVSKMMHIDASNWKIERFNIYDHREATRYAITEYSAVARGTLFLATREIAKEKGMTALLADESDPQCPIISVSYTLRVERDGKCVKTVEGEKAKRVYEMIEARKEREDLAAELRHAFQQLARDHRRTRAIRQFAYMN